MREKQINISYFECDSNELSGHEQHLVSEAHKAALASYAPYSKFRVGAAVLLENGEIIAAGNQENAAYPSGMCAERNVLYYSKSKYPDVKILMLMILAIDLNGNVQELPVSPCGSCRQVIAETVVRNGETFRLLLHGAKSTLIWNDANLLLPLSFGPADL